MDDIRFPYRGGRHTAFLEVIDDSGAWENHGLNVDSDRQIVESDDAKDALLRGGIDFVGGNHLSPYAERTRGKDLVYVGQTTSHLNLSLVTRPGLDVETIEDLRGKRVGAKGKHPGLNAWLYLDLNGVDVDAGDATLVDYPDQPEIQQALLDEEIDAAFLTPPRDLFAERAGLKIASRGSMPMVHWTTLTTTFQYVEENPDVTERFIRAIIEGIAYFKNNPERATEVIQSSYDTYGEMDREAAEYMYEDLADMMVRDCYPTLAAIENVYRQAVRQDEAASEVNPLELWELRFLRRISDSGFVDELY